MVIAAIGVGATVASTAAGIASSASGGSTQSSDISAGQAQANAAEQKAYGDYQTNAQPYITTGTSALSSLGDAAGLNGASGSANALSSFQASPGYAYQLQQGLSAIDNGAASTGTLRSGNTIRAEETLGSNLANQDFGAYYSRLQGLANSGLTATNSLGSAGLSAAAATGATDTSAATAQSNIAGSTSKSIGNALSGLAGNAGVQSGLKSALSGLGSSGVASGATIASQAGTTGTGIAAGVGGLY